MSPLKPVENAPPGRGKDGMKPLGIKNIRYLDHASTEILWGFDDFLYVVVKHANGREDELYRGVFAVLCFPVSHPHRYVSLRYHDELGHEVEIGVILDPSTFPVEARRLLARSLAGYYFEFEIERVLQIRMKYHLLMFDVITNHGFRQFEMRWRGEFAYDLGEYGKALIDVFECRYIIRDVRKLPREDQALFTRYIYW
jgi:hypothetical protein